MSASSELISSANHTIVTSHFVSPNRDGFACTSGGKAIALTCIQRLVCVFCPVGSPVCIAILKVEFVPYLFSLSLFLHKAETRIICACTFIMLHLQRFIPAIFVQTTLRRLSRVKCVYVECIAEGIEVTSSLTLGFSAFYFGRAFPQFSIFPLDTTSTGAVSLLVGLSADGNLGKSGMVFDNIVHGYQLPIFRAAYIVGVATK
jgi:hypothetical protein